MVKGDGEKSDRPAKEGGKGGPRVVFSSWTPMCGTRCRSPRTPWNSETRVV